MIMNEVMLSATTTDEHDNCFGEDDVMTMITTADDDDYDIYAQFICFR